MFSKERFQLAARVREKRLINEIDRRRRALDVKKNDADLGFVDQRHADYFAALCGGMYLEPRQTGS